MCSTLRLFALAAIALLASPGQAGANPWTRAGGSSYVNLSYATIGASRYYATGSEKLDAGGSYRQHTVALYGEVGIVDRWLTGVVDLGLFRRNQLAELSVEGIGDLRVGFRSGLLLAPIRLTVGLIAGIPTGNPDGRLGDPRWAPLGDGEPDLELTLSAGYAVGGAGTRWPIKHYVIGEAGYWVRTHSRSRSFGGGAPFGDALNWRFETGLNPSWPIVRRLWLIGRVYGSESFASDAEVAGELGLTGLGNGVSHRSYGFEAYLRLWRGLGVSAAMNGAFHARGIAAGAHYRFGLSFER